MALFAGCEYLLCLDCVCSLFALWKQCMRVFVTLMNPLLVLYEPCICMWALVMTGRLATTLFADCEYLLFVACVCSSFSLWVQCLCVFVTLMTPLSCSVCTWHGRVGFLHD